MNRILFLAIPVLLLLASCAGRPAKQVINPPQASGAAETPLPFIIVDYKNRATGGSIPKWVSSWLEEGVGSIETQDAYIGRYVFISRNESNNFNALTQWAQGFNAELDFPRLAAARIEKRFLSGVSHPDHEYGTFFEALIRAASDTAWTGAIREDDFWLCRRFFPGENSITDMPESPAGWVAADSDFPGIDSLPIRESWEFLILVTIEKRIFASQLDAIFRGLKPNPPPAKDQINTANRVKDKFFDGF